MNSKSLLFFPVRLRVPVLCLFAIYGTWKLCSDLMTLIRDRTGKKKLSLLSQRKPPEVWNTVIFFPDYEGDPSAADKILHLVNSARKSIKICMFVCSFRDFMEALKKRYEDGLNVQVITDHDSLRQHNNYFRDWIGPKNIRVRAINTGCLMHHKFVIIDDEAVITGSLNWTAQGVYGNEENVLVTTDPRFVRPFLSKYAELYRRSQLQDSPILGPSRERRQQR